MTKQTKILLTITAILVVIAIIYSVTSSTELFQGRIFRNSEQSSINTRTKCYDSDGGLNSYGSLNYEEKGSTSNGKSDYCNATGQLVEYSCRGDNVVETKKICDSRCYDGKCVTESNIDTTTCGDSIKQAWEECDGENFCDNKCEIKIEYPAVKWEQESFSSDHKLKVGDKLLVGGELNIRIEKIDKIFTGGESTPHVKFSIWGKNTENECKFVSNTGELTLKNTDGWKSFREFTDSFIELVDASNNTVTIRQYYGPEARQRCEEIAGNKKDLACSFYPDNTGYYVENAYFRVHFNSKNDQGQQRAEYTADALLNCFNEFQNKFPATIKTPFSDKWAAYPQINNDSYASLSADYQRISLPSSIISFPIGDPLYYKILEIQNGQCPITALEIPHELTHMIFANTILQRGYDHNSSILPNDKSADSLDLSEGQAVYLPYFIGKDYDNFENKDWDKKQLCLKDSLKDTGDGAKPEQLNYKNIFAGKGYSQNHYDAGYCFFDRVENKCGKKAINYLLETILKKSGSIDPQSTIFSTLLNVCQESEIKEIMTNFGFDNSLLDLKHTYPVDNFDSGDNSLGCY